MRKETLCFLVKKGENKKINEICLAMKKKGFGSGKWNGAGGKVKEGETIKEAAIRESQEEICVTPVNMWKVAVLEFRFNSHPELNAVGYIYLCDEWKGRIAESEEMAPEWFRVNDISSLFPKMWAADIHWLPRVLQGEFLQGDFLFEGDDLLNYSLQNLEEKDLTWN